MVILKRRAILYFKQKCIQPFGFNENYHFTVTSVSYKIAMLPLNLLHIMIDYDQANKKLSSLFIIVDLFYFQIILLLNMVLVVL